MKIILNKSINFQHCTYTLLFFLMPVIGHAQFTVTGSVSAGSSGEALIGANIIQKNSIEGTVTDIDGFFTMEVPSLFDTLIVSYIGFQDLELVINGRTHLEVTLMENASLLDEIVVVGYGVQRKSDLTGSISSVKGEEIQRIPTANVEQALQG